MRKPSARRLSRVLLLRAGRGVDGEMLKVRRRVECLRRTGRIGFASLMGEVTADQASIVSWFNRGLYCHPYDMSREGISELAQCEVFELVYPLIAHMAEVRARSVYMTSLSPMTLAAALRINREITGVAVPAAQTGSERVGSPICALGVGGRDDEPARFAGSLRLLLEAGVDREERDRTGNTPLLYFVRNWPGRFFAIEELLRRGADPMAKSPLGGNILHVLTSRGACGHGTAEAELARRLMKVLPGETLRKLLGEAHKGDGMRRPFEMHQDGSTFISHDSGLHRVLLLEATRLWVSLSPVAA